LHKNFRTLENDHNELTSQQKLESDIDKKLREKEKMRKECEWVDARHRMILDDYLKYKKHYSDMLAEIEFLEAQVNQS
jgi:hypothetical protein